MLPDFEQKGRLCSTEPESAHRICSTPDPCPVAFVLAAPFSFGVMPLSLTVPRFRPLSITFYAPSVCLTLPSSISRYTSLGVPLGSSFILWPLLVLGKVTCDLCLGSRAHPVPRRRPRVASAPLISSHIKVVVAGVVATKAF